ncbi:hypothetical protein COU74_04290 [Candidatus Peregrinibacteria bacterium CG10_big_fil_rev_8_21_14_0_10_36_19]|nr:MAG: hypothetical protein COU74_04290 [Candidatus Peregrinibacteria bacterium CG10_big_fil_rev_8_21_14_0_10_36_19]
MKNILLLVLFSVFLSACTFLNSNVERVGAVNFYLITEGVTNSDNYTIGLNITPDYESRSLEVEYLKHFLSKGSDDVDSEGVLAGEFFDKFENVIRILAENHQNALPDDANFKITIDSIVENELGKEWGYIWGADSSEQNDLQNFFLDVADRFSGDVY